MTVKIITMIACSISAIQTVNTIDKGDLKRGFSSGFVLLTMALLARIYF